MVDYAFSYTIKVDGATLVYPNGNLPNVDKVYKTFPAAPNGIALGADMAATIAATLANLQTFNHHPAISYSIEGSSIFVTIVHDGVITIENVTQTGSALIVDTGGELVFTTDINPGKLRMAFNNDIIRFYTTNTSPPKYCDITAEGLSVHLLPDPDGRFFFNFRPYVAALVNTRNFDDTTDADLNVSNPSSFVYDFTSGTYLELEVAISITTGNNTVDSATYNLSWIAGVEQINDYHNFSKTGTYLLSPFRKLSGNSYYLKYWQGYPFDIALYTPGNSLMFANQTNLLSVNLEMTGHGDRLFFSDGRTDETLEDLLPLVEGLNKIRMIHGPHPSPSDKFIYLDKMPYTGGVYLKWLNSYGGYSYWLFEDTYTIDRSTKQLGEIDRELYNLEDTITRTYQLGKESQDSMRLIAELLNDDERRVVEGILDSPKIYLFTGQPYARSSRKDWVEVSLKTTGARLKNAKQPLTNFTFDIELPQRYTQRL